MKAKRSAGEMEELYMLPEVLLAPWWRATPGVPRGLRWAQREAKERVGEVPAEGAELHPKVPTSKEECAITISRGERDRRSKVE